MNTLEPTATTETTKALERRFCADGFFPGVPPHIDGRTRASDAHLCRRMKCPGCRKRKMVYRPFSDGKVYRVLASCQNRSAAEEV